MAAEKILISALMRLLPFAISADQLFFTLWPTIRTETYVSINILKAHLI